MDETKHTVGVLKTKSMETYLSVPVSQDHNWSSFDLQVLQLAHFHSHLSSGFRILMNPVFGLHQHR